MIEEKISELYLPKEISFAKGSLTNATNMLKKVLKHFPDCKERKDLKEALSLILQAKDTLPSALTVAE